MTGGASARPVGAGRQAAADGRPVTGGRIWLPYLFYRAGPGGGRSRHPCGAVRCDATPVPSTPGVARWPSIPAQMPSQGRKRPGHCRIGGIPARQKAIARRGADWAMETLRLLAGIANAASGEPRDAAPPEVAIACCRGTSDWLFGGETGAPDRAARPLGSSPAGGDAASVGAGVARARGSQMVPDAGWDRRLSMDHAAGRRTLGAPSGTRPVSLTD